MEDLFVIEKDGKRRKAAKGICKNCNNQFLYRIKTDGTPKSSSGIFCSRLCAQIYRITSYEEICDYCSTVFVTKPSRIKNSKSGYMFCSRNCKDIAQKTGSGFTAMIPAHYGTAPKRKYYSKQVPITYRTKALKYYGPCCMQCGYKETSRMLDVHHIDGDRKNPHIDNLAVLCVWCHALKTRANWPERYVG